MPPKRSHKVVECEPHNVNKRMGLAGLLGHAEKKAKVAIPSNSVSVAVAFPGGLNPIQALIQAGLHLQVVEEAQPCKWARWTTIGSNRGVASSQGAKCCQSVRELLTGDATEPPTLFCSRAPNVSMSSDNFAGCCPDDLRDYIRTRRPMGVIVEIDVSDEGEWDLPGYGGHVLESTVVRLQPPPM